MTPRDLYALADRLSNMKSVSTLGWAVADADAFRQGLPGAAKGLPTPEEVRSAAHDLQKGSANAFSEWRYWSTILGCLRLEILMRRNKPKPKR